MMERETMKTLIANSNFIEYIPKDDFDKLVAMLEEWRKSELLKSKEYYLAQQKIINDKLTEIETIERG